MSIYLYIKKARVIHGGVILEEEIEHTRELMIKTASIKGLGACETIELSRKLDALMNHYETHVSKNGQDLPFDQETI